MMEEDSGSESCEIPESEAIPLDYFRQVIQAFHKPIGKAEYKPVQNLRLPITVGLGSPHHL